MSNDMFIDSIIDWEGSIPEQPWLIGIIIGKIDSQYVVIEASLN